MTERKLAFLFPGQGSQFVGMGHDLSEKFAVAKQTFEEADEALGFSLSKLCFEGPEEQLKLTEFTQPAIFTVSIAAQRVLAEKGVSPSFVAGHSLGEYSANVAAGEGAMAAILGLAPEAVIEVCANAAAESGGVVSAANLNSPEQIVISGA